MATFDVLVWKITTSYTGTWAGSPSGPYNLTADNYLHVQLNDVTNALSVQYTSALAEGEGTIYASSLTDGPNLFFGYDGAAQLMTVSPYYQYCEGTTLHQVGTSSNFPYGTLSSNFNNSECQIAPTCDLEISNTYTITDASAPATADGSIVISATSSNGTIKYSLDPDFDYVSGGQTSTTFSGLYSGDYTIYAKDAVGCQDNISFTIVVTEVYGVRFRLDFTDLHNISQKYCRIDIEERAYSGAVEEICGGDDPILIRYAGDRDNPSNPFVPSDATLSLLVETSGYFNDLFQGDDRKYKVKFYIGDSVGTISIYWTGFIIPEFHSEPYIFEPYIIEITASDQLGELKNEDFYDLFGNKIKGEQKSIKVIAEILKKTSLNLSIRSGVNVFDSGMDTAATDDPYDQAYVDTRIFYSDKNVPLKSDAVLKEFMHPFRAQIFQSQGYWYIIRLSDAVGTFAYRQFDYQGTYVSNSTLAPVVNLDFPAAIKAAQGAMFSGKTQIMSFMRNYGYFAIVNDLKKDGNLIDSGRFEEEDIIQLGSGNYTFEDWNVLLGQAGVQFGLERVQNGDSLGAFYFDYTLANNTQADTQLYSTAIPVDSDAGHWRFKFQYMVSPKYTFPYVRLAWTLKFLGSDLVTYTWITFGSNGVLTIDNVEQKNEIYVTNFNSWQSFDLLIPITLDAVSAEISFFFHNHYGRDFDSILVSDPGTVPLESFSFSTVSNPNGLRRMVSGPNNTTYLYTAFFGNDATSSPDFIRPTDYNVGAGSEDWMWKLDEIMNITATDSVLTRVKFDNVSLAFYPQIFLPTTQIIDPPTELVYEEEVSQFVSSDLEKPVLLGDMIRLDDEYTRNEAYLYRSYFRLSDGTPTLNWNRTGVSEAKRVLQILLEDYISQFSDLQKKLSGSLVTNQVIHFVNCLEDQIDNARYRPMTFEFNAKRAMYTTDMVSTGTGAGGEPPIAYGAFEADAFSTGFLIGA